LGSKNKKYTMKYLLIIASIIITSACTKQAEVVEENFVEIPKIEILSTNKELSVSHDTVFFQGKLYSGFVLEKYENGQVAANNGFFNGKLEGKQEKYYPDGSKMELRFYHENRKNGTHHGWWQNGQMKFEYFIKADIPVGTHKEWYPSGQLYSLYTYNQEGQPEGKQQMWFETGQVKSNYVFKDGRRFGFLGAKGCMGENERKQTPLNNP